MSEEMNRNYRTCKNQQILERFIFSGLDCMELKQHPYKNTQSARMALRTSAKRFGYSVIIMTRKGRIFLVRDE